MPGVYGDQLASFPELMKRYKVFTMRPKAGGGFEERVTFKERMIAYLTRDTGGHAGIPDDTFVEGQQAKFFVFDRIPKGTIRQGLYVEDDGELFKFVQDNSFAREGGFIVHRLEIVTGPTDQQVQNVQVEENIVNAY